MKLIVSRMEEWQGSTLGALLLAETGGDRHLCYTLEDGFNAVKLHGKTRIPAGLYELKLRQFGGFHKRYTAASWLPAGFHKGMIEVMNVPGFTDILHHTGNTKDNTEGCSLYGLDFEKQSTGFFLNRSRDAYKKVYPDIARAIMSGELVTIEYKDNDR